MRFEIYGEVHDTGLHATVKENDEKQWHYGATKLANGTLEITELTDGDKGPRHYAALVTGIWNWAMSDCVHVRDARPVASGSGDRMFNFVAGALGYRPPHDGL